LQKKSFELSKQRELSRITEIESREVNELIEENEIASLYEILVIQKLFASASYENMQSKKNKKAYEQIISDIGLNFLTEFSFASSTS